MMMTSIPAELRVFGFRVSSSSNARLETRNSKLETRNSKLETRNSKLETPNSRLSLKDRHRRIPSAGAHDAAARMRRRTTHVKVLDRRTILRPSRRWSQKEELLQRQLALKDVSF